MNHEAMNQVPIRRGAILQLCDRLGGHNSTMSRDHYLDGGRSMDALTTINPHVIRLEASSHCQLRCPSCPTTTHEIDASIGKGFLKFSDFKQLLDCNPRLAMVELSNYGEIMLNPVLLDIVRYAYQNSVGLAANNGVNLNSVKDEVLEGLVKYRFRAMTCSIDGASDETYRVYRVRGHFEKVIEHIRRINFYKGKYRTVYPRLNWSFVIFGHNEHELPKARQVAHELGMRFRPKLTWDDSFSPIRDPERVRREVGAATREDWKQTRGTDYMLAICHQLWDQPQINWDGKVLGCCRNFWGDFGGNAFQDGLVPSVNNEKIRYARQMLLGKQPPRDDIPCSSCSNYLGMQASQRWLDREAESARIGFFRRLYHGTRLPRVRQWLINHLPI